MAWTTPKTWAAGVASSADLNTHVRDNLNYVYTTLALRAGGIEIFPSTIALATGDGKKYLPPMPSVMAGYNLTKVTCTVFADSTSGAITVQVARGRQANPTTAHAFADMLSTRVTIDQDEYCSLDAATAAVVDTTKDDIAEGDILRVDVDGAGTGATGLWVTLEFTKP
jgi:hypothetical protein